MAPLRVTLFLAVLLGALVPCHGHKFVHPLSLISFHKATVKLDDSITLTASPDLLVTSGSWVNVTYKGVENPKKEDVVAMYSPTPDRPSLDPRRSAPIKFIYASASKDYLETGAGSYRFHIVNYRARVVFAFIRGNLIEPEVVAVSNFVSFKNYNEPLQQHLALTNKPNEMLLVWSTLNATKPTVRWGTKSRTYTDSSPSKWSTYRNDDMCGDVAAGFGWREPGLIHVAVMDNLKPATKYYYQCGDDAYGWSSEFSFVTPPTPSPSATTRVVAYGDLGQGQLDGSMQHWEQQPALNTTRLVTARVNKSEVDVVLHIGDMSYAVGYSAQWDQFFDQILPIASRVPYMVCIGNHERDYPKSGGLFDGTDSGGECGVPHERRMVMPRPAPDQPWYGFDYGCIHFVLMSTEHSFDPASPQYTFLEDHLQSVDRSVTPWLVFAGHRPMYIDSTDAEPVSGILAVAKLLRKNIEPLLLKYNVDLALWGHHHSYQRTCPVAEEVCTVKGITHVVIGMAGKELTHDLWPKALTPKWIQEVDDQHHGYSHFTANASTLTFQYIRNVDEGVGDYFVLNKP